MPCHFSDSSFLFFIFLFTSGPMMHQQPPSQQYNMPPGGGGQHYQGQQNPMGMIGQVNQGNHVMGQRPMPPYRPPQQGIFFRSVFLMCASCECWSFLSLTHPPVFLTLIPPNSLLFPPLLLTEMLATKDVT